MGTTSSSASSLFTGSSAYSQDLQNIISRAVGIANLPIQILTNQQTALNNQSTALNKLDIKLTALQAAVSGIRDALGGSAFQTEISNDSVVGATLANGAVEGVYSIKVNKLGSYATSQSKANWDSSGSTPNTYTLLIGNKDYTITPANNSAASVAAAINARFGNVIRATAVNVAAGDTRISLQSNSLDPTTLDLFQIPSTYTPASLQQQSATGYAVSQSAKAWDSSGAPAAYTLVVGGNSYSVSPADNTADSVVAAINSQYGDQVQASVVNVGTGASPDYRIRLEGAAEGAQTLDLQKDPGISLQTQQNAVTSRTAATWDAGDAPAGDRFIYTLVIGGNQYSFTPADNSAATVASTINSLYGSQVRATVLDLGTGGSHDYRISLQNLTGGSPALDIQKTTAASLQDQKTPGALAQYEINGSGVVATSNTRSITVADGVTLNLLATSDTPVDVTVTRSTSALSNALSSFAGAYNAVVDELATEYGQTAGPLQGQSILSTIRRELSNIATYSSSDGQVNVLKKLGLDLGKDGHFQFNALGLMATDIGNSVGVTSFLGSSTGGGWLKALTDSLNNLEDPLNGLVKTAETSLQAQITTVGKNIADKQNKVTELLTRLQAQMAAADAMLSSMEQQYSYMTAMFQAQDTARRQYSG
jgi:flagellar capping protein FliD